MKLTRLTRWSPALPYEVPRDLPVRLPDGMTYAATGRMVEIGPESPSQSFALEDWGQPIASQARALLLVSAADCSYLSGGTSARRVYTFCPMFIPLAPGQRVAVSPVDDHTGELWAFPLRPLIGPPTPPFTTLEDTFNAP